MTVQDAGRSPAREPRRAGGGVVVGFDGSPSAEPALEWAAAEAVRRGAPLTVLCAAHTPAVSEGLLGAPTLASEARSYAARVAEDGAARVAGSGVLSAPEEVRTDVRLDDPTTALVEASRDADLLVVGNRGRGALVGALLGSVAFSVTAAAACPVVVVRGRSSLPPGPEHPVVVGVDGSDGATEAVRFAAATADRAGAPLHVVSAWTCPEVYTTGWAVAAVEQDLAASVRRQAVEVARAAAEVARSAHPSLHVRSSVAEDSAPRALAAASRDAGLVVVGARGHGCLSGLFLGSVSHATIHSASCPVAVVRAPR